MSNPCYEHFDEWWDLYHDTIIRLGYSGKVDRDAAHDAFDRGENPEDEAAAFVKEMSPNP